MKHKTWKIQRKTLKQERQASFEKGYAAGKLDLEMSTAYQQQREMHARRLEIMGVSCELVRQAGQNMQAIAEVMKAALYSK